MARAAAGHGPTGGIARSLRRAELWLVGGAAAFVAGFALVAVLAGGEGVVAHVAALEPHVVAGLCGLSLVNYAVRAARWQVFSRRVGVDLPWATSGLYYVAGFAMAVTPGKLGEVLRLWLLHRGHGYRYERTAGMLLADKLSDAGALLLLCLLGAFAFAAGYGWTALGLGAVVVAATALCLRPRPLIASLGWTYARLRRWPRPFARARTALRRLARLGSWRIYGGTLLLASLGWFAEASALYWLLQAMGAPVALVHAVFIFAFAMLVGSAAMLPGGLGGTEVGMIGLLAAIGVEFDVAVAATAVIRATTLWFAVGLGFLALPPALRAAERAAAAAAPRAAHAGGVP